MSGQEIKALIWGSGLKCWEVANELGMSESVFSRRMREPFDEGAVAEIKAAIEAIKSKK